MTDAMSKNMPLPTATKLLPAVETLREKHDETERPDNGEMTLTTTGLNGKTEEDLSEIIARYMETLSPSKVHILGNLVHLLRFIKQSTIQHFKMELKYSIYMMSCHEASSRQLIVFIVINKQATHVI